jgi:predicted RNA binding protein YcfA (HicA-like mRNA interferase family)
LSKIEKLIARLRSRPKDFTWQELQKVLAHYGYEEMTGSGSRRKFIHPNGSVISLHEPHPSNVLKAYALKEVIEHLKLQ